ncbi:Inorganic pyrophosphatase [Buchnera aphidicola (Neophyllaphis podocarpi)]|uniref:inorganic diphosphatase n=1 Tax=Buchnera aphidicola TaxID=9 RepID=UPI0031B80C88
MRINNIPVGKNVPEDIYVIIEIPFNSNPIKYEINKKYGVLFVDRFIPTTMFYPCNYGYINQTLSLDKDPIDVLIPTPYPLQYGSVIRSRPIGILKMIDESGIDMKIIAVPHDKICTEYKSIINIDQISKLLLDQIIHFFKNYKNLENNKWVKIQGWGNHLEAKEEILNSYNRFSKK